MLSATDVAARRPISVFLLIRSLALGGAQRQIVQLAAALRNCGHPVTVGTFYSGGPLAIELKRAGVPIVELRKGGRWDTFGFLLRLRRAIRSAEPDVLYSFTGANVFATLVRPFLHRMKLVLSIRASDMDLAHYDWVHRLGYEVECGLARFSDLIISNSRAGMEFAVAHGFPGDRVAIVPNGIDTDRFRPNAARRKIQRRQWGISESEIVVGMLARLDPMKGHVDLLDAARRVASVRENVRFVLVGDGRAEAQLKKRAAELDLVDKVLFAGPTDDPAAALNGFDLFCSASVWGEGFSNAVGEAMACGLRCVVTDVGDSAAIVGDCGLVVPPANASALADAIISQLGSLGEGAFSKGRSRIVERFSIAAMVDQTVALLQGVVDAHQG
jgi:glycosyltransferase involved in cell wall biosynthesis